MKTAEQKARLRLSAVKYAMKHTAEQAALRFDVSVRTIYYWKAKYDGTLSSLSDKSSRPHSHPAQHTAAELDMIKASCRRCPHDGLVVRWVKLRQRGYQRSLSGLYRVLQRIGFIPAHLPNPKRLDKQYEQMQYPGQRVQVDVKYVPSVCTNGEKYYQFTAIDEYSRYRYLEAFPDHSTYSGSVFLEHMIRYFPFKVECVQTDHGSEFVKWSSDPTYKNKTMFQNTLEQHGIKHKLIRPYTPRHNGKVERSHRKDNEWFYSSHKFYNFEDFKTQLRRWNNTYNKFPQRPLNWLSPREYLSKSLQIV